MIINSYYSNSGKDLILDYIKSLPDDEKVDGLSVLESLEKGEMDKIKYRCWPKKQSERAWENIRENIYLKII